MPVWGLFVSVVLLLGSCVVGCDGGEPGRYTSVEQLTKILKGEKPGPHLQALGCAEISVKEVAVRENNLDRDLDAEWIVSILSNDKLSCTTFLDKTDRIYAPFLQALTLPTAQMPTLSFPLLSGTTRSDIAFSYDDAENQSHVRVYANEQSTLRLIFSEIPSGEFKAAGGDIYRWQGKAILGSTTASLAYEFLDVITGDKKRKHCLGTVQGFNWSVESKSMYNEKDELKRLSDSCELVRAAALRRIAELENAEPGFELFRLKNDGSPLVRQTLIQLLQDRQESWKGHEIDSLRSYLQGEVDHSENRVLWKTKVGSMTAANRIRAYRNSIYVSSAGESQGEADDRDGLYKINAAKGQIEWKSRTANDAAGVTIYDAKRLLIASARNGAVYFIGIESGTQAHTFTGAGKGYSSPLVVNNYVFATIGNRLNKIGFDSVSGKPQGLNSWASEGDIRGNPVEEGGIIFFADEMGYLYALREGASTFKWKQQIPGTAPAGKPQDTRGIFSTPIFVGKSICVGNNHIAGGEGSVAAVHCFSSRTGELQWSSDVPANVPATLLYRPGHIYFPSVDYNSREGRFYQVAADTGMIQWTSTDKRSGGWSAAVFGGGRVYHVDDVGRIRGYDPETMAEVFYYDMYRQLNYFSHVYAPPLVLGTTMYVGDEAGYVYAIDLRPKTKE